MYSDQSAAPDPATTRSVTPDPVPPTERLCWKSAISIDTAQEAQPQYLPDVHILDEYDLRCLIYVDLLGHGLDGLNYPDMRRVSEEARRSDPDDPRWTRAGIAACRAERRDPRVDWEAAIRADSGLNLEATLPSDWPEPTLRLFGEAGGERTAIQDLCSWIRWFAYCREMSYQQAYEMSCYQDFLRANYKGILMGIGAIVCLHGQEGLEEILAFEEVQDVLTSAPVEEVQDVLTPARVEEIRVGAHALGWSSWSPPTPG